MRAVPGILLLSAAIALAGCGTSENQQVRDKIDQFATAAARHDYTTICNDVLAPSLVDRLSAAGVSCVQAMKIGFVGVQDLTLSIGKITVSGDNASVITLSGAKGQHGSVDALELTKTAHGWRVASLGAPTQTVSSATTPQSP